MLLGVGLGVGFRGRARGRGEGRGKGRVRRRGGATGRARGKGKGKSRGSGRFGFRARASASASAMSAVLTRSFALGPVRPAVCPRRRSGKSRSCHGRCRTSSTLTASATRRRQRRRPRGRVASRCARRLGSRRRCGHALLGFVASSSESGAAAFAHGTFSCCPHNFQHATFHALPTSATLARAPACCALCPHIHCACVGTALCCLPSTAVRCQCTLYKHHAPVCSDQTKRKALGQGV